MQPAYNIKFHSYDTKQLPSELISAKRQIPNLVTILKQTSLHIHSPTTTQLFTLRNTRGHSTPRRLKSTQQNQQKPTLKPVRPKIGFPARSEAAHLRDRPGNRAVARQISPQAPLEATAAISARSGCGPARKSPARKKWNWTGPRSADNEPRVFPQM